MLSVKPHLFDSASLSPEPSSSATISCSPRLPSPSNIVDVCDGLWQYAGIFSPSELRHHSRRLTACTTLRVSISPSVNPAATTCYDQTDRRTDLPCLASQLWPRFETLEIAPSVNRTLHKILCTTSSLHLPTIYLACHSRGCVTVSHDRNGSAVIHLA